jgi:hypothetical protein
LVPILGIALLVFSLIEGAARRALAAMGQGEKVANLLAGHVAARPAAENVLKALQDIALATVEGAGVGHRLVSALSPLYQLLLRLVVFPRRWGWSAR